jgi:RNA polymerase sigma-70 factor (ECF subfamily)
MSASSQPMDPQQRAVTQLVKQAGHGDQLAQQELWNTHRRWVAAIILAHRPRSVEVDDLMQEVALKLVDKLDTLRDPEAFRPWLRQIVINVCRGAGRALKPTLSINHAFPNSESSSHTIDVPATDTQDSVERADLARHLLDQVMGLPPEYREPLLLRAMGCLSYQQISEMLGLPVTTIETRLARARRMVREEMPLTQEGETTL